MQVFDINHVFQILILVFLANGAPILAKDLLGSRWQYPVDFGFLMPDGNHLFGKAKTWRGVVASIITTTGMALLLGMKWWLGALFGALAMVGDLLASFIKRRLGCPESSRARGLDTVPESLLPVYGLSEVFGLNGYEVTLIVIVFLLVEEWVSPLLYRLHIRDRPY